MNTSKLLHVPDSGQKKQHKKNSAY